ncbi:formylglycine-generating enzyme family protein [Pontibacter mangrovi]|uniref:Formylglycine-generating enzyme family protein n=1 Tax=Pontibacter mangrovi TaxID=2589816 RepID=A0A501W427_9BACT|nr:SUMF1/EgtB/PvdO family nonheme iron enzyme [Pontibacter mangrovi]TPE44048.1 formylglycine-generating enzyme family protein [Pontibacter mangrovi]
MVRLELKRTFATLLGLVVLFSAQAQELQGISLSSGAKGVKAFTVKGKELQAPAELPLVYYEVDKKAATSLQPEKKVQVSFEQEKGFTPGYKGKVTFKNTSPDTVWLSNVVPLGREDKAVYITGKGEHPLSRTHLFLPGKSPVNVIVPDNAWELGYTGLELGNGQAVCALVRRDLESMEKATRRRFETVIAPGGSVKYDFYADAYNGDWQQGLKKMFQERYLYDVASFDNTLFEREDLKWIRHTYVMHLLMGWDKFYYDDADGKFHLEEFLKRGQRLYGGDDAIGIWPTWPTLGLDQRNQFDLFRDLPGGLAQVRQTADETRSMGTAFFICYNPWDESTRDEGHMSGIADIIKNTGADGVVLDTKGSSSKELQEAADEVKKGVIMYSEGMAVPKDMQGIVSGRVHNALYYAPMLNLNKFIKPEFAIYRVAELYKEPIQREYATSFFNGYGTELNIFAPGQPSWAEEQYNYLGRTSRILRENTYNFTSKNYTPLIPVTADKVYANKWVDGDKVIYTIYSIVPEGYKDLLFEVQPQEGRHFVDLWHHKELQPEKKDGKFYVEAETDAFHKAYLGTNNEGEVDCIAELPVILKTSLESDMLLVSADKGDQIKIWAGVPDYEKKPLELKPGSHQVRLLDHFGRFEGKFIIQLFNEGILLDENIVEVKPGTPRLTSEVEKTTKSGGKRGMVKIPAGKFTFKATQGDDFIPYPKYNQGRTYQMNAFYMDKYPVTNAQFEEFLNKSKYTPADTANFLKHWVDGKIPAGTEDHPVTYVSYEDAKAYAKWAGKRLPTEVEWQYAAQTPDGRAWPWSAKTDNIRREEEPITGTLTVFKIKGIDPAYANLGNGKLDPVGSYPKGKNPYGLQDLVGSVWQLTNDEYRNGSYDYVIMKGGSYYNPTSSWWYVQGGPRELHYRQFLLRVSEGFERNATVGFRCVKDN